MIVAEKVAARIPEGVVGFDPATILSILSTVLPLIVSCFQQDEPEPAAVQDAVREQNAKNPKRLRRRLAAKVMRDSPERKLSKEDALVMAEAIVDEALEADNETVEAFVVACSTPSN